MNTTVQVGGAIGLAVLATLASERTGAARPGRYCGYHLASPAAPRALTCTLARYATSAVLRSVPAPRLAAVGAPHRQVAS